MELPCVQGRTEPPCFQKWSARLSEIGPFNTKPCKGLLKGQDNRRPTTPTSLKRCWALRLVDLLLSWPFILNGPMYQQENNFFIAVCMYFSLVYKGDSERSAESKCMWPWRNYFPVGTTLLVIDKEEEHKKNIHSSTTGHMSQKA